MKKLTTALLLLFISFCFVLSGCGTTPLTMPENYSNPVSNGGFVVGAGNYMYFANAYKAYSSLSDKSDNDGTSVAQHSLKRVKINDDRSYLDIIKDEEQKISYENVINKIAGFEVSSIYVVNEYLYFASPNVHKNKENAYEFNLISFFRIKLDGSGLTEIFTSKTADAKVYLTQNNTLLVFDDAKIKKIDLENNSTTVITLAENVESTVFPETNGEDISWIYYTSAKSENSLISGNILKKVSVKDGGESIEISKDPYETIKIVSQNNGIIFYTKSEMNGTIGLFSNNGVTEKQHRTLTTGIDNETDLMYVQCENVDNNCFVFLYEDKLYIQFMTQTNDSQAKQISSETTTIHFSNGNWVYYSTTNGIYRYSVLENRTQQISDHSSIQNASIDFDGRYVYYFVKIEGQQTETEYLYRADCYSGEIKTECIAEVLEKDIVEEKTEEEAE